MKTTVTLTPENAEGLAWAVELTGLSIDEIVNLLLKDDVSNFQPDYDDSYPEELIGNWKLKDRASAECTLKWVTKRVRKGRRGKYPIVETESLNAKTGVLRSMLSQPGRMARRTGSAESTIQTKRGGSATSATRREWGRLRFEPANGSPGREHYQI